MQCANKARMDERVEHPSGPSGKELLRHLSLLWQGRTSPSEVARWLESTCGAPVLWNSGAFEILEEVEVHATNATKAAREIQKILDQRIGR